MVTTAVMMTGSIEYIGNWMDPYYRNDLSFQTLTFIMLVVFILLIPILLVNLLVSVIKYLDHCVLARMFGALYPRYKTGKRGFIHITGRVYCGLCLLANHKSTASQSCSLQGESDRTSRRVPKLFLKLKFLL